MERTFLGEFQELVLLTVVILGENAYGITIQDELEARAKRPVSRGALHTALSRLTDRGYLQSHYGGATAARGGRRKRFYQLTRSGQLALQDAQNTRQQFWQSHEVVNALGK